MSKHTCKDLIKEQQKIIEEQEDLLKQMITKVDNIKSIAKDVGVQIKSQCNDLSAIEHNVCKSDIKIKKCSKRLEDFQPQQSSGSSWIWWLLFG